MSLEKLINLISKSDLDSLDAEIRNKVNSSLKDGLKMYSNATSKAERDLIVEKGVALSNSVLKSIDKVNAVSEKIQLWASSIDSLSAELYNEEGTCDSGITFEDLGITDSGEEEEVIADIPVVAEGDPVVEEELEAEEAPEVEIPAEEDPVAEEESSDSEVDKLLESLDSLDDVEEVDEVEMPEIPAEEAPVAEEVPAVKEDPEGDLEVEDSISDVEEESLEAPAEENLEEETDPDEEEVELEIEPQEVSSAIQSEISRLVSSLLK